MDTKTPDLPLELPRRIRVEVKNQILGDSVFWEGPVEEIEKIHNIPARETAKLVAKDGRDRVCGMWHVYALSDDGNRLKPPPDGSAVEGLKAFVKANVSAIRPQGRGVGQHGTHTQEGSVDE